MRSLRTIWRAVARTFWRPSCRFGCPQKMRENFYGSIEEVCYYVWNIFLRISCISTALKTIKNTLTFFHCILKTTLAKSLKRQHEITIKKFMIRYFCTFFVASKFKSNQKSLQPPMQLIKHEHWYEMFTCFLCPRLSFSNFEGF